MEIPELEDDRILALAKAKRESEAFMSSKNMERIRFAAWYHYGLIFLVVIVTGGWLHTQWRITALETQGELRQKAIDAQEGWKVEHQKSTDLRDQRITQIEKENQEFRNDNKHRILEHDQMWWMYQMKLTNKDVDNLRAAPAPKTP